MTYSQAIIKRLTELCSEKNLMRGKTQNPKLKTLHKLAIGLDMTVSELLDFPEMNETAFEDE